MNVLSDRKKKIIQIVVDNYIENALPVSSKHISDNYLNDLSSATVRNELSALEEMGYLVQLHTSGGRIPSAEAYKLYVEELMKKQRLSHADIKYIKELLNKNITNTENLIKTAVKLISELTNYTTVAVSNLDKNDILENIKIMRVKPELGLLLLITQKNFFKDATVSIPANMDEKLLADAENLINSKLKGKKIKDILDFKSDIETEFAQYRGFLQEIIKALDNYSEKVLTEGEDKIFNLPESRDIDNLKGFLSVVTSKEKVASLLNKNSNIEISVSIGSEKSDIPQNCSLISARYSFDGIALGTYGVIGPMRMDYNKVVSVLENIGEVLKKIMEDK